MDKFSQTEEKVFLSCYFYTVVVKHTVRSLVLCCVVYSQNLDEIARDFIGHSVFVGWPHMYEALVEAVASDETRYYTFSYLITEKNITILKKFTSLSWMLCKFYVRFQTTLLLHM